MPHVKKKMHVIPSDGQRSILNFLWDDEPQSVDARGEPFENPGGKCSEGERALQRKIVLKTHDRFLRSMANLNDCVAKVRRLAIGNKNTKVEIKEAAEELATIMDRVTSDENRIFWEDPPVDRKENEDLASTGPIGQKAETVTQSTQTGVSPEEFLEEAAREGYTVEQLREWVSEYNLPKENYRCQGSGETLDTMPEDTHIVALVTSDLNMET